MAEADEAAYKKTLENSTTTLGYTYREKDGRDQLYYDGIPIISSQAMPAGSMVLTAKSNVVIALEEEIRYVWYDMPKRWASALLLWVSMDIQVQWVNGIVKCTDLNTPTITTA